mmetsp:Transcript_24607/g.55391  ORF Transcript_24607/g.55391 Transcript_24607/m.55391 type:complete len:755 (-) Transcript_24607:121-2385(-)
MGPARLSQVDSRAASYSPLCTDQANQARVMGVDLEVKCPKAMFVMVFSIPGKDKDGTDPSEAVKDAEDVWKEAFTTEAPDSVRNGMARKEFCQEAYAHVISILEGEHCGFFLEDFLSIDQDEHFVSIHIDDQEVLKELAVMAEARARVKKEAYTAKECHYPTEHSAAGGFHHLLEVDTSLDGKPLDNACPAFVRYDRDLEDCFEDFTLPDKFRIVRRAILRHVHVGALEKAKVISKFFAAHDWEVVQELYNRGWSQPHNLLMWPRESMPDYLNGYFGAQVAYYFHLFNCFVRWVSVPAVVSVLVYVMRISGLLTVKQIRVMNTSFGAFLCLWTTCFLAYYHQQMHFKTKKWGFENATTVAMVRKQFRDDLRGSCSEGIRRMAHWLLCGVFILETVGAVAYLSNLRRIAFHEPEGTTFGISNTLAMPIFKYVITANIKAVDFAWTAISTALSNRENFRTDPELRSGMVLKLFAVKFVIFYYPFVYTIFIQPYVEGCQGDVPLQDGGHIQGCLDALRSDLSTFFFTQVILETVEVIVALATLYWSLRSEMKRKKDKNSGAKLSYLELQAMAPAYENADETADYMAMVMNFGFISMFGVTTPAICALCFLANFPLKRLSAYKFCFAYRRVIPRAQEGIGSWSPILNFLAYAGVMVTTYIVIFVFHLGSLSFTKCLLAFLVIEHLMAALKFAIDGFLGKKSVAHQRVDEYNDDVLDDVLDAAMKKAAVGLDSPSPESGRRVSTRLEEGGLDNKGPKGP